MVCSAIRLSQTIEVRPTANMQFATLTSGEDVNVRGKLVNLRAVEFSDLEQLRVWSNDPEVQQWLGGWHLATSSSEMERWFHKIDGDPTGRRFAIDAPDLGLIGTANLVDINWKDRNAFHGMLLGHPEVRGKGYGVDTVMAVMRYAFDELGLQRLDGSIIEYNDASRRLYIGKCGWKLEGTRRDWYFRKGRYWDMELVGVTRDDYSHLVSANHYWGEAD